MWLILYISILFLTILITYIKYNRFFIPNVLFTLMWTVSASLASLGLYNLYKPSIFVHVVSITSIIIFNLVFFISKNKVYKHKVIDDKIKFSYIYILNLLAWIYSFPFLIKSLSIISSMGFKGLRLYVINSEYGYATTTQLLIIQWLVQAIFIATILIGVVSFVNNRHNKFILVISIFDVVFYTLLFAERYMIARLLLYFIFAILINKKMTKTFSLRNIIFVVLGILSLYFITNLRTWGDSSFLESIIVYFSGSFVFLSETLKELNYSSSYLFGLSIFGFIVNIFIGVFSIIFNLPYRGSNYIINSIAQTRRLISPTQYYNAMTTMLFPFWMDFGFLGIIIGTIFLAVVCNFFFKLHKRTGTLFSAVIYVYLLFVIFDSVMSYQLLSPTSGITILLIIVFFGKIKFHKTNNRSKS